MVTTRQCAKLRLPVVHAAVSKAFSCLSDAQKRAAYDRYGEEEPGMSRTTSRGPFAGPGYDEFDPNEIFNMFFGGGFGGNRSALP